MNTGKTLHIIISVAALLGAAMFVSCKNDEADIDKLLAERTVLPTVIENYYMERCDSGLISMRMHAGKVVIEPSPTDLNVSDKKGTGGILILSYKKGTDTVDIKLTSNSAIEHGASGLSEALGNVIVSTASKDSILTERLIWDKENHIFYTDNFARIVRSGDVMLPKKGFKADENFRWYQLFNSSGEISIEDSLSTSRPTAQEEGETEEQIPSPQRVIPLPPAPSAQSKPTSVGGVVREKSKTEVKKSENWQENINTPAIVNGVPSAALEEESAPPPESNNKQ